VKTYGTLRLVREGRRRPEWRIAAEPQVALRLKRVFARIAVEATGEQRLLDTPEVARDLLWFLGRYPLECPDLAALERRAAEHVEREQLVLDVLAGAHDPAPVDLAGPVRGSQRLAVELALRAGRLLLADDVGLGKAQPVDSLVLTPSGWKTMGEIQVGDTVVDPDGGTGDVTGVFPRGVREVYRVTMGDGAATECCDEHLWLVMTPNDRCRGGGRVLPLASIKRHLFETRGNGQRCGHYFIPMTQPVELEPSGEVTVPPYLLGALLGDGDLQRGMVRFSCNEPEVLERASALLPSGVSAKRAGGVCDYRMTTGRVGGNARHNPLLGDIRKLGLEGKRSWEKRVPPAYMAASAEDRLELLRGLMDTDGTCGIRAITTFTSTSSGLARDVADLVRGLGGMASIYSRVTDYIHKGERRKGRRSWTVNIRLAVNPFHLPKKAARWRPSKLARAIKSVESAGFKDTRCIKVSTQRNLYITDDYIVTHNTAVGIGVVADPRARPAAVVTLTHLPRQWRAEIDRFAPGLDVYVARTANPEQELTRVRRRHPLFAPDVYLLNYHKLAGWAGFLKERVRAVVFDEAQELRRPDSAKYRAAREVAAAAAYRLQCSATPVYNYGAEIYHVLDVIAPDALGMLDEFSREWCGWGEKVKEPKALGAHLRDAGLMLRRTRAEVGRELPALQIIPHEIDADLAVLDEVENAADELARIILTQHGLERGAQFRASEELSALLRQATGVAKAPFVAEFVRMLVDSGEKVLLYGWHHEVYSIWRDRLKDLEPAFYTGRESVPQKAASLERFAAGDTPVLVMSLRAGQGVDGLQEHCRTCVVGELDWSPGVLEQCVGRLHRDGQAEPVVAYYLVADSGSDPIMADVLGLKRRQAESIRDPGLDLIEKLEIDEGHVRRLAEAHLARKGRTAPAGV
jgi:hypothetical protein